LALKKQNIAGVYKQINLDKIELIGEILEYKNEYYCKIYCSGDVILIVWDNATQLMDGLKFELSYDTPDAIISNKQIIKKMFIFPLSSLVNMAQIIYGNILKWINKKSLFIVKLFLLKF